MRGLQRSGQRPHSAALVALAGAMALMLVASPVRARLPGSSLPLTPAGIASPKAQVVASTDRPLRVLLLGDSLAWEARQPFVHALTAGGRALVDTDVFGGTALCDWLPGLPAELRRFKPDVAVLEFVGNEFTRCTKDPRTGRPLGQEALVALYARDAATAAGLFRDAGTTIYWATTPPPRWGSPTSAMVGEAAVAASGAVAPTRRIDAAAAVEKDGSYTDYLPCLPTEPCPPIGPGGPGLARVRSPDGTHFCPTTSAVLFGVIAPCLEFSSGAWRYGAALAAPLLHDYPALVSGGSTAPAAQGGALALGRPPPSGRA